MRLCCGIVLCFCFVNFVELGLGFCFCCWWLMGEIFFFFQNCGGFWLL